MRSNQTLYLLICLLLTGILCSCGQRKLNKKDWEPTYESASTLPYGTYITYQHLSEAFKNVQISHSSSSLITETNRLIDYHPQHETHTDKDSLNNYLTTETDESLTTFYENYQTYKPYMLMLTAETFPEDKDVEHALLDFVGVGNSVFISAEIISRTLLNRLSLSDYRYPITNDSTYMLSDSSDKGYLFRAYSEQKMNKNNRESSYFALDSIRLPYQVLGTVGNNHPSFIRIKYGFGSFYLHTAPRAFTNITMLDLKKYDYGFRCLALLPQGQDIIWNESIKYGLHTPADRTILDVLFKYPSLKWGFIILIIGLLLYMLFRGKRVQRIIPVIKKPENTTLEFLNTLSNMYYRKSDYSSSMKKRHTFFLEYIRKNYYMHTENIDSKFIQILSNKSNVPEEIIKEIFSLYEMEQDTYMLPEETYMNYNEALEKFYNIAKNKP